MQDTKKLRLVALTGAGISAESGLKTFRDSDGLWEGYHVQDVATPEAWERDPETVQKFYNERRKAVLDARPNPAHFALAELQDRYDVCVVTQNIDDLHERAGSKEIVHLHGIITRSQSSADPAMVFDLEGAELRMGEKCPLGSQLRPHVVWFGEPVPMIERAAMEVNRADIFLIVGTSLQVYPAAGLINYFDPEKPVFIVDPKEIPVMTNHKITAIRAGASEGMRRLMEEYL